MTTLPPDVTEQVVSTQKELFEKIFKEAHKARDHLSTCLLAISAISMVNWSITRDVSRDKVTFDSIKHRLIKELDPYIFDPYIPNTNLQDRWILCSHDIFRIAYVKNMSSVYVADVYFNTKQSLQKLPFLLKLSDCTDYFQDAFLIRDNYLPPLTEIDISRFAYDPATARRNIPVKGYTS